MKSALARLRPRNATPVPIGGSGSFTSFPSMTVASPDSALLSTYGRNGTVQANVSLLASSTAGPVWKLFRAQPVDGRRRYTTSDQGSDQRVEVVNHQALSVLDKPASMVIDGRELVFWTRFALFELSQIWMDLVGKATWIVEFDPRANFPVGLWPVRPDRLTPVPDPQRYLKGWVYTAPGGNERIPLAPHEVIFNRYPDPSDIYGGVGPVRAVLTDIEASDNAAEYNRNFFLNSAIPGGVLQADHELSDVEYNNLVNRWREAHRGVSRAHRIALLEAGVTWVQTHLSMKDMDFAVLRTLSRDLIRESLGMHKVMTGVTDDVNRANAQTGEEVFSSWKIKPRLERWRDVLNYQFLPLFGSAGQGVEFDFILPTPQNREQDNNELAVKCAAAETLVSAGFDATEALQAVGLPDMKWTAPAPGTPPLKPADKDNVNPGSKSVALAPQRITAGAPAQLLAGKDPAAKVFEQQAQDYPPSAMAWMHHASWKGPVKVPLDHIEPQMKWMDGADPDHIQEFVARRQKGKKLKPLLLVKTPGNPKLQLIDGHHRYLASAELGEAPRAFIGSVTEDHGPWETMHDYQLQPRPGHGKGRGDGPGNHLRPFAVPDHAPLLQRVLRDGYVPIDSGSR